MEIKISDMMNHIQDDSVEFCIPGPVSPQAILAATRNRLPGDATVRRQRRTGTRVVLIAAALAMLLSAGVLAVYRFGLKDLAGAPAQVGAETVQTLSLTGLRGTPEYAAAEEWEQMVRQWYDAGENLLPADDGFVWDTYAENGAISREARDALDTLLTAYGLRLSPCVGEPRSLEALYSLTGADGFMPTPGDSGGYPVGGKYYADGSLAFNCAAALPGGLDLRYQFYAFAKGSFHRVGHLLADVDAYEEWIYTTPDGVNVLLAIGAGDSILAADLDESFVIVHILSGTENQDADEQSFGAQTVSREDLEAFAGCFDFSVWNTLTLTAS